MGARHNNNNSCHPIVKLIQDLPMQRKALHDIHLRFESKGLWSLMSVSSIYKADSYSKDIRLSPLKASGGSSSSSGVAPAAGARDKRAAAVVENRHMTLPPIPEHKDWIVTMWHFGMDASVEYTGERFSATWEIGQNALVRAYSKEIVNVQGRMMSSRHKNVIRLESQEYHHKTLQDAIQEKLGGIV